VAIISPRNRRDKERNKERGLSKIVMHKKISFAEASDYLKKLRRPSKGLKSVYKFFIIIQPLLFLKVLIYS
jgi:hypothetical protein